jgi:hypothetical protein
MKDSPCILVDLNHCYLPYDHGVRKQIRKTERAEKQRQACKEVRTGMAKPAFLDDYLKLMEA